MLAYLLLENGELLMPIGKRTWGGRLEDLAGGPGARMRPGPVGARDQDGLRAGRLPQL